ncbi:M1 family metallopeptidase [Syntrophothermus lipocalidus]|uniref:Peptidase M1 membrane alanine aminopeptidase n=1 Tax=Syntrophothermus lipocalidus (strain DSM 12680 / TGB-C1) TaxID=643648 RepID=D7CK76_SYNLT|nr:M1 family metallopeptidase [Syntrophothermus lipocalidus]ADI03060.1 Peptidase M1 membrane alanine aminopeptidase [Syntrophothermus lipocalidus DSM 12680]HOV43239.1 M1 family metallopeptidase [Syntrophothermus lipocalidus]
MVRNKRFYLMILAVLLITGAAVFVWKYWLYHAVGLLKGGNGDAFGRGGDTFPPTEETRYNMGLYLDVSTLTLYGTSVIETENNLDGPLSEMYFTLYPNAFEEKASSPAPPSAYKNGFDPGYIRVTEVKTDGIPASYEVQGTKLKLTLEEALSPGQPVKIEMAWKVKIPQAAYRFGAWDGVFMLSNFYPVLTVRKGGEWRFAEETPLGDPFCFACADYLVKLNLPSEYQVVSTGHVLAREAGAEGRDTVLIEASRARDFVIAATWRHQQLDTKAMNIPIRVYVNPGYEDTGVQVLSEAEKILEYYACTFGSYPYEELDIIQVPMDGFQGMEYSGVIFLQDQVLSKAYSPSRREFLLAHEIAHQWWFGLVGNDQSREPWLDEGLANWSAGLCLRRTGKQTGSEQSAGIKAADLSRSLTEMRSRSDYLYSAYRGGEAFWNGLEGEIGTDKVVGVLRRYLAENRYGIATSEDVLRAVQNETGKDMTRYFSQWFRDWQEKAAPVVKVKTGGD